MPLWTVNEGPSQWGFNTLTWSRVHYAAGSCVLCAAFMLGTGSAMATADAGSGSHSGGSATHSTNNRGTANKVRTAKNLPVAEVGNHLADVLRKTINDVTSILSTGRIASRPIPGSTVSKTAATAGATNGNDNSGATTAAPDTTATPPAGSPVSNTTVPAPEAPAPVPTPVATPTVPPPPIGLVPFIVTPVVDVITSVQDVLTSVVDYAAAPLSTDLSTLLGVTQWQSVVNVRTEASTLPTSTGGMAPPLSFASPAPESAVANTGATGLSAVSSSGVATSGNIEGTSTGQDVTAPAQAPATHTRAVPMTLKQFFRYAVDEVLRSPSLSALAALALPGLIGLIIILGAGMRFGYRQAKAALALPASGLTRFARPQPLRLVRSRSSAAVSRPARRFVPTELSAVDCPMENAA
jgi:hypothetical protein